MGWWGISLRPLALQVNLRHLMSVYHGKLLLGTLRCGTLDASKRMTKLAGKVVRRENGSSSSWDST